MRTDSTVDDENSRIWEELATNDFALTSDRALGFGDQIRRHISGAYFTDKVLESDHPAVHVDRDRARDVIRYCWHGDRLSVREHDEVAIRNRSGFSGSRTPARTWLLDDPPMREWIEAILRLIPPHLRQDTGTFGVNFLRTRTDVVSGPHRDDEEYVLIFVVDKVGAGAETTLHPAENARMTTFRHTLVPGEMVIFRDAAFLHNASKLWNPAGGHAQRDAVVCTVNYGNTYELGR